MNPEVIVRLAPLLCVGGAAVAVMVQASIRRSPLASFGLTLFGLLAAFATVPTMLWYGPGLASTLVSADGLGLVATGATLISSAFISLFAHLWLNQHADVDHEEFHLLLLLATLGACTLAVSNHFMTMFLGIESMSIAMYGLVGYKHDRPTSIEAAMKYLVLSGVASGFLVFGMSMVYFDTGLLDFASLSLKAPESAPMLLPGIALILAGLSFKLALVPFHSWTPDVYQGAPPPTTALLATVSKIGAVVTLIRLISPIADRGLPGVNQALVVVAVVSMVGGTLLGARQTRLSRMLGYSSTAHMGYLLLAIVAGGAGVETATVYTLAYASTALVTFGTLACIAGSTDVDNLADLRGLGMNRPLLGAMLLLSIASLAGLPFTIGFVAKLGVLSTLVAGGHPVAAWALVASSLIGAAFYLRAMFPIFQQETSDRFARSGGLGLVALAALTIAIGFAGLYPAPLIALVHGAIADDFATPLALLP
jgi:NADH-quinone oxidoreductase subunit N